MSLWRCCMEVKIHIHYFSRSNLCYWQDQFKMHMFCWILCLYNFILAFFGTEKLGQNPFQAQARRYTTRGLTHNLPPAV